MLKPPKIFLYYLVIILVLVSLCWLLPEGGIPLGNSGINMRWPSLRSLMNQQHDTVLEDSAKVRADTLAIEIIEPDSIPGTVTQFADSIPTDSASEQKLIRLVYKKGFKSDLYSFYQKIKTADDSGRVIRVLHMGDSQIEGDRITRYIRESFQRKFKGAGPGLVPLFDPHKQSPSVWITNKGKWSEHLVYKYPRLIKGNQYGLMGKVSKIDSVGESSVLIGRSSMAMPKASGFYKTRLFLKSIKQPLAVNAYWGRQLISTDSLGIDENITEINWTFERAPRKFSLSFESEESPLFLGLSLDSLSGIAVDNIAMRGQSSPRLDKTDTLLYKSMASYMNIGMIILQYGTNMVPTITEDYHFYSLTFYRQLKILKKVVPNVPVVVVGVGDVGKLTEGKAESYKHICKIKEAQKEAALKAGFAFFDLFEAMGGEGSMLKWVNGDPKLAMSDYTHFNKPGGKKVASWLYRAIMSEYDNFENLQQTK